MKCMLPWPSCLAVLVIAAFVEAQDESLVPDRMRSRCGALTTPSGVVAAGATYKACFTAQGVEFTPALGRRVPSNQPLQWSLAAISRDGPVVPPADAVPVLVEDGEHRLVRYARDCCEERYEIRSDGVAQSFLLSALPSGRGDLVVRGTITTALAGPAVGDHDGGVAFSFGELEAVTLSAVEAIDARGRCCPGSIRWHDGCLDYVIPAAFIDSAAMPLLIDPIMATGTAIYWALDMENADVDFETSQDVHLMVYEVAYSSGDIDVYGERFVARQLVSGLLLIDYTTAIARHPRVIGLGDRGAFVVSLLSNDDVHLCPVSASGQLQPMQRITNTIEAEEQPEIGVDVSGVHGMLVWRSLNRFCRAHLNLLFPTVPYAMSMQVLPGSGVLGVAISRRTTNGRWLVATEMSGPPNRVYVSLCDTLLPIGFTQVSNGTFDCRNPAVDGDGENWLVGWDQPEAPGLFDRDVHGRFVHATQPGGLVIETSRALAAAPFEHERAVSIGWMGDSYLVGWSRRDLGNQQRCDVMTFDGFTCLPCEAPVTLGGGRVDVFGMPGFVERNMITVTTTTISGSPVLRLSAFGWRAEDGHATDFGGGCGL